MNIDQTKPQRLTISDVLRAMQVDRNVISQELARVQQELTQARREAMFLGVTDMPMR
jgi:hypothetical protein